VQENTVIINGTVHFTQGKDYKGPFLVEVAVRKWWKSAVAIFLTVLGPVRWIVDTIGRAQTVSDLPFVKYLLHPYFPPMAFTAAVLFGAWAYYDLRMKKEHAGFIGTPENKNRYRKQAISGAVVVLAVIVVAPLIYGRFHRTSKTFVASAIPAQSAKNQTQNIDPSSPAATPSQPLPPKTTAQGNPASDSNADTSVGPKVKVEIPFVADAFPPAPEGEELPRKYPGVTDGFGKHVTFKNNRIAGGVRVPQGGNPQDTKIINNETLGNTLENAGKMERTTVVGKNNVIKNDAGGEMKDTTTVDPPQGSTINIAPNGFAISGGNVSNPTVNNFAPFEPDRHVPEAKHSDLVSRLSQAHGIVEIDAYQGGTKAYRFAEEWRDIFKESRWDMKYDGRIHEFSMGSHPFAGIVVRYHGVKPLAGTIATMPSSGLEMYVVEALSAVPGSDNILLSPEPGLPEGMIVILIGPMNKPTN
jgi:hypothetical protein